MISVHIKKVTKISVAQVLWKKIIVGFKKYKTVLKSHKDLVTILEVASMQLSVNTMHTVI